MLYRRLNLFANDNSSVRVADMTSSSIRWHTVFQRPNMCATTYHYTWRSGFCRCGTATVEQSPSWNGRTSPLPRALKTHLFCFVTFLFFVLRCELMYILTYLLTVCNGLSQAGAMHACRPCHRPHFGKRRAALVHGNYGTSVAVVVVWILETVQGKRCAAVSGE